MTDIKANRARWCEVLRSGTIPQVAGKLRVDVGRCCLGVAADLFNIAQRPNGDELLSLVTAWDLLALNERDQIMLSQRNDGKIENGVSICHPHNFNEIAKIIENMPIPHADVMDVVPVPEDDDEDETP